MNKPESIIIHHSLTKDSDTLSWGPIRSYHISKKYDDIGYHYGIELVRDGHEILSGRMPDNEGAHCVAHGYNKKSIGICLVGNFDKEAPPPEQIEKLVELVLFLMRNYDIDSSQVVGHGEIDKRRTCPGKLFSMHNLRLEIKMRIFEVLK